MPSEAKLAEMARQIYGARPDARVKLSHDGHAIRRYRGRLHVQPDGAGSAAAYRVAWAGEPEVALGEGRGAVRFERATGAGLGWEGPAEGAWFFAPRTGGERLRLRSSGPSRTLKNLLQERGVPPWQRDVLPLLFHGERLVWVPGVGIEADYACREGRPGLRPCWEVAGNAPLC
jgi:tRNA(Ile)-lysidine synthase